MSPACPASRTSPSSLRSARGMPPLTCPEIAPIAAPAPPPTVSAPRMPTAGNSAAARARPPPRGGRAGDPPGGHEPRGGPCRQSPPEPVRGAVPRRLLVLLDDLDLAVLVAGDDRRVEVVRGLDLVVERLHGLVVA